MKPEHIEQVMTEVLEELRSMNQQKEKDAWVMEQIGEGIKSINDKLASLKMVASQHSNESIERTIKDCMMQIASNADGQPKDIVREFHLHLFPKLNIKEYYQTYSRLLFYFTIFLFAAGIINICTELVKGYNERQAGSLQNDIIQDQRSLPILQENKKAKTKKKLNHSDSLNTNP